MSAAQPNRLATGGRIDRTRTLSLRFDGRTLHAHPGDTLAAALLAAGIATVGRSFKYHRRRGIFSAGVEEPNALVTLGAGARCEPNTKATIVEARAGLDAQSQNRWPALGLDLMAVNGLLAPFLPAGFYYKTFFGPAPDTRLWMFCERFIRRAAGLGRATLEPDPDGYEKVNGFCDLLVIGGGPAGLAAALAAGRAGARVTLAEQDFALGGALLSAPTGGAADRWLAEVTAELEGLPNVRLLTRTTVFGAYDGEVYGLIERVTDHLAEPPAGAPRQRYWLMHAAKAVLAAGALERPLLFGANDKPGVMLAGAAAAYVNRFAVLPGRRAVVATTNDTAYGPARALARAGAQVTLVDARTEVPPALRQSVEAAGVELMAGHTVTAARGRRRVRAAEIGSRTLDCDLIAVSGGWTPTLHLWSQRGVRPAFDAARHAFVPVAGAVAHLVPVGACAGSAGAVEPGFAAGRAAAHALGHLGAVGQAPDCPPGDDWTRDPVALGPTRGRIFVDLQNDVTVADLDLAHREGFAAAEHAKRYTTTGMATDQGKTANVEALARLAELSGVAVPEVGTTTFRPPYTPITIGAIVGHGHGALYRPVRRTAVHDWHEANGARMSETGPWMRPWYYPRPGEDVRAAYKREAAHVRAAVGMVDVSTLGKIAVQGPDAAEFLNRVYVNGWKTLKVGRIRYGVMLRDDGFVFDDGTTARLAEHDYLMTTTTANAGPVLAWLEHLLQTAWTDLKVQVTSVSDQWAAFAVAGPRARDLLRTVIGDTEIGPEALPNNAFVPTRIAEAPVRLHRMSYSGELAYEVYAPAGFGRAVWQALIAAGRAFDLIPYGTEAMGALRTEKGHVAGPEIDGRTTLRDLGLAGFASSKKPFVGGVLARRPGLQAPDRPCLVGLACEGEGATKAGALLYGAGGPVEGPGEGWVTSTTYSSALGRNIALALLANGAERRGETVLCVDFVGHSRVRAEVVSPHFFDPEGKRQNA